MPSQKKMLSYASIGIGGLGIILALSGGPLGFFGAVFSLVCTVIAAVLLTHGFIVMPFITRKANISIVSSIGDYEIPPAQDVVVKHVGNVYYATAFLSIEIYESPTQQVDEGTYYNEFFERAVSNLKYVSKIAYIMYVEDISKKRQEIDTKRAEIQLKLQRERDKGDPDPLRLDKLASELKEFDYQLEKLIRGIKPMGVIAYAMTTAAGISKDAAITAARAQAEQVRTAISNSLNVEVKRLSCDEMLKCFEWEKFFPTSIQELEDAVG